MSTDINRKGFTLDQPTKRALNYIMGTGEYKKEAEMIRDAIQQLADRLKNKGRELEYKPSKRYEQNVEFLIRDGAVEDESDAITLAVEHFTTEYKVSKKLK